MFVGRAMRAARGAQALRRKAIISLLPAGSPSYIVRSLTTRSKPSSAQAAVAAAATEPPSFSYPTPPSSVTSSTSLQDDSDIRPAFDRPVPSTTHGQTIPTGLFMHDILKSPSSLPDLTTRTLVHAAHIVRRISTAPNDPSGKELRLVVKNLDRLSDLLCGVIDMCELVRNVHPDQRWVMEADRSYERLCSFMNGLNTDRGLFESLSATMEYTHNPPLSGAETQVALTFLRDFEKSGIDLPPALRARFVELSDDLLVLGRTFLSAASSGPDTTTPIEIPNPDKLLSGMGSQFVDVLPRSGNSWSRRMSKNQETSVYVDPGSWEAQMIGRYAREGEARRLVYTGGMRPDAERIDVLETMLVKRAELAGVLGKETWAEVALGDKMAKTPGNVMGFLTSLAAHHRPFAAADVDTLARVKANFLTGNSVADASTKMPPLYAWDRDFFTERYLASISPTASLPSISPYLSTGTVMTGLSRLFSKLYGISFRPAEVAAGEVWHPSVRKLDVVDEVEGPIGAIYCDLFGREGKPPSAAHYTVRCSRRVDDDDVIGDGLPENFGQMGPGLEVDGEILRGKQGRFQLPIVVLTTDLGKVEAGKPCLLSWSDVETLFHEMGHAIHSMIGRTEYHNVSGTRCATDFVELPSILMEHFVSSPEVLSLFATHYATNAPLPMPLLQAHLALQRSFSALETHGQILMAVLDQKYHSITAADRLDSTKIHYDLQAELGVIPPVEDTAWQTQFGHLYGYGATYYSYLFDRAIAGKVWTELFSDPTNGGALSREGGERFKQEVLKWGGGRDPWEMVGSVVGGREGDIISRGDEKAMGLVGGWLTT